MLFCLCCLGTWCAALCAGLRPVRSFSLLAARPQMHLLSLVRQLAVPQAEAEQGHAHIQAVAGLAEVGGAGVRVYRGVNLRDQGGREAAALGQVGSGVESWMRCPSHSTGAATHTFRARPGTGPMPKHTQRSPSQPAHLVDTGQGVHHHGILPELLHGVGCDDVLALGLLVVVRPALRSAGKGGRQGWEVTGSKWWGRQGTDKEAGTEDRRRRKESYEQPEMGGRVTLPLAGSQRYSHNTISTPAYNHTCSPVLEALLLDARLVQHIHIRCHLAGGQEVGRQAGMRAGEGG